MAEYIEREAIANQLENAHIDDDGTCSQAGSDLRELLDEIEGLPTIIPAEEGEI